MAFWAVGLSLPHRTGDQLTQGVPEATRVRQFFVMLMFFAAGTRHMVGTLSNEAIDSSRNVPQSPRVCVFVCLVFVLFRVCLCMCVCWLFYIYMYTVYTYQLPAPHSRCNPPFPLFVSREKAGLQPVRALQCRLHMIEDNVRLILFRAYFNIL